MPLPWDRVHLIAAREAARAFLQLGVDTTRRVDPFAALEAEGVLALRRPLDRVAGMYLPGDGGRPGALINVLHPPSKQRFTAAHELAHHRRDRLAVLDQETEWIARGVGPESDRERIAEAFAAWFLMPRRLVEATLSRLGLQTNRLDAEGAYALSLELGTSYAATVRHLADMRLLSSQQRDRLLRTAPQAIKRALGALDAVADAWRDVWLVRPAQPDRELGVREGDALWVELPEAPSSGYRWQPAAVPEGLSLVRDEYRAPSEAPALGGRGTHRFLFRVDAAGERQMRLEMRRPWQREAVPAEEHRVRIAAEPKPTAGVVSPRLLIGAGA